MGSIVGRRTIAETSMTHIAGDTLQTGREAAGRRAWSEAYALFSQVANDHDLAAEDLDLYADAAWWTAHLDEALALRERAHSAYLAEQKPERAALVGLTLA